MIEVYYAPPSIYGRKVLTVLLEKDLDFQIKPLSFQTQDYLQPEYLKLNPNGEIPTLVDDDRVIYESTAIAEYLDEEYPEPPLMPADSYERAKVRIIDDFCDLHLYRSLIKCIVKKLRKEEISEQEKAAVAADFKRIESYLGKKDFLAGNFSLADCAFMPAIPTAEVLGFEALLQTAPAFKAYIERLRSRASFRGALLLSAENVQDFVAATFPFSE